MAKHDDAADVPQRPEPDDEPKAEAEAVTETAFGDIVSIPAAGEPADRESTGYGEAVIGRPAPSFAWHNALAA